MIKKIIPTKQLVLLVILGLTFFGLGIASNRLFQDSNSAYTPNLSDYEWELKIDGSPNGNIFHRWAADQQMTLEASAQIHSPAITYKKSARLLNKSPSQYEIIRTLKFWCDSQGEVSQIEFNENTPPYIFEFYHKCGNKLWSLRLQLI